MKLFKSLIVAGFVAISFGTTTSLTTQQVSAAVNNDCTVTAVGSTNTANQNDSKFTQVGNKVTAKITVSGANCNEVVTIASWETLNQGAHPLTAQRLYKVVTGTFAVGTHSLTVEVPTTSQGQVPNCYFQVDLLRGDQPDADPSKPGAEYYAPGIGMGWLLGGSKECVTPETPETPTKDVLPETLPNTGAGSIVGTFAGVTTLAGAIHYAVQRRRLQ